MCTPCRVHTQCAVCTLYAVCTLCRHCVWSQAPRTMRFQQGDASNRASNWAPRARTRRLVRDAVFEAPCSRRLLRGVASFEARRLVGGTLLEAPCWRRRLVREALFESPHFAFSNEAAPNKGRAGRTKVSKKTTAEGAQQVERSAHFVFSNEAAPNKGRAGRAWLSKKKRGGEKVERSTPNVFLKKEQGQRPTAVITWLFQKASASRVAYQQTTARTRAWRQNKR